MKNLAFYIGTLNRGGAERVIVNLAHDFAATGQYRCIIITTYKAEYEYDIPNDVKRIQINEENDYISKNKLQRNLDEIKKIKDICNNYEGGVDLLIAFLSEASLKGLMATRGIRTNTLISVRCDPKHIYTTSIWKFVAKSVFPLADGCVFQTNEAKAWFPKKLQRKSRVINNDVAQVFFDQNYCPSDLIVNIGRLTEQKNQKLLIDAFSEVSDDYNNIRLEIYGSGELQQELQQYIDSIGLHDRVFLMGNTDHIEEVLSKSGMFVLTSDFEGVPNALLEALAVGVPSISTDCSGGGPREVIKNGVNGILINPGNKEMLTDAMRRILDNPDFAKQLSKNAKKISRNYSKEKVFSQWKEYIDTIIEK